MNDHMVGQRPGCLADSILGVPAPTFGNDEMEHGRLAIESVGGEVGQLLLGMGLEELRPQLRLTNEPASVGCLPNQVRPVAPDLRWARKAPSSA
jgi:hypothetical protein